MDPAGLIASFEEQLRAAKPIPLTNQVRLDKNRMQTTVNEMRTAFSRAGLTNALPLVNRLDEQVQGAKPVPLTDEVRLEKDKASGILDQLRASVAPATN